jgi:aldose sugar dehydrogenase
MRSDTRGHGAGMLWALEAQDALGEEDDARAHGRPATGELFDGEHGPRGGDEIDHVRVGHYGWPVIPYGMNYDG